MPQTAAPQKTPKIQPTNCTIIGAGIAGAAIAHEMAKRGWQVTIIDKQSPASGASGLPAGIIAPHISPDEAPLSKLTQAGATATLALAKQHIKQGQDYKQTGVQEREIKKTRKLPEKWQTEKDPISIKNQEGIWHKKAGWIKPPALIKALLNHPNIKQKNKTQITQIKPEKDHWITQDQNNNQITKTKIIFITAGYNSKELIEKIPNQKSQNPLNTVLPLNPLRGQITKGKMPKNQAQINQESINKAPINGHGSIITDLPPDESEEENWWITGSTFERGSTNTQIKPEDGQQNIEKLKKLAPEIAEKILPKNQEELSHWAGIRATLPDRLPAIGEWELGAEKTESSPYPPQILTGLGARGLTLSILCAQIIAAQIHGEESPIEEKLTKKLKASRFQNK